MIDWSRVATLKEEIGADAFAEVVGLFLSEMEELIATYDETASAKDREGQLHAMKGSALNLGFAGLAGLCAEGEAKAADETLAGAAIQALYATSRDTFLSGLPGRGAA